MGYTNQNSVEITGAHLQKINLQDILSFQCEITDTDMVVHSATEADFSASDLLRLKQSILERLKIDVALLWNKKQEE
jgi:hypothetical protein